MNELEKTEVRVETLEELANDMQYIFAGSESVKLETLLAMVRHRAELQKELIADEQNG